MSGRRLARVIVARLFCLLAVCFFFVSPSFGQTRMDARRSLLQAEEYLQKKSAKDALAAVSEGLATLDVLGEQTTILASALYRSQARAYRLLRDDANTVASFEKALEIVQMLVPEEERAYQQLLLESGDYHRSQKSNDKAIALYLKALQFEPRPPTAERLETAKLLHNLACVYRDQGELERAFEIFEETLARKERLLSKDDPSVAITLNEFGGVCRLLGRFELAEEVLQRALEIRKARRETAPADYARALNSLSLVKQATGSRREALRLVQESCEISVKIYGPDHPETVVPQMNLAQAYASVGEFEKAELLYRQALATAGSHYSPESLEVATLIHNLGTLLLEMDDLESARLYLEQALAIRRRQLKAGHQDLAPNLINLATVHRKAGRYDQALALYQEALTLTQSTLGPDHPDLAYTLDLMAGLPSLADQPDKVLALNQRAHEIRRKAFGPKAAVTAYSLYSLALLDHRKGDLKRARVGFESSWEIFKNELGASHAYSGKAAHRLGSIALEQGDRAHARFYAEQEAKALLATTEEIYSFASERQRLAYAAQQRPYDLPASLGDAKLLASAVLRYKGTVLDSMMEDLSLARESTNPEVQARVEALLQVRDQLSSLLGESSVELKEGLSPSGRDAGTLARLRDEVEKLEAAVTRDGYGSQELRRAFRVTPEEVIKSLPARSVLIELIRYGHLSERGKSEEHYGAVILAPGEEPIWRALGSAAEIDAMIGRYKRFVRAREAKVSRGSVVLQELHQKIWRPLEDTLASDIATVFLSPDSELSFLSFATLLDDEERFLGQRYDLLYVSSGRDLLRELSTESLREAVLFGDPIFTDVLLEPLPFTRWECQELAEMFQAFPGWTVKAFLGAKASEAQVKAISRPSHLHIATHGYFNTRFSRSGPDPMAASGLVLSPGPLKEGQALSEDGYLTAGEVSLLDLRGTLLVTLSACDTGLGLAQAGEGVLGLRRGFLKAGARNLVMTLWSVSDDTAANFMRDFVARSQNVPPALALAQVQREWLTRLSQEHSPERAVREVGPFVLNLQGRWTDR